MPMRLLIHDELLYEGEPILVPRIADGIRRGDELRRVEAVTWDFSDSNSVTVTLLVGEQPYTY